MHRPFPSLFLILLVLGLLAPATLVSAAEPIDIDSNTFGGLRARAIGPAVMSGRIAALDGVATDPVTLYVGTATGGIWKSIDAGVTFEPIFDDHPQSIGAIKVDPSDPEVIWAGTGETWVRNSVSVGRGVYRSGDGGETWKLMGLEDSERIGGIRIDPTDGDTVFVCATGHLWDANEERGVFKTTDGGASWNKVLYVDENTGCADIDLDPQDPSVLYAGMWQFRRSPDFFTSGGPGSGFYKSTDGGENWTRLEGSGLPEGELGRIAIAIAPSRPSVVYATIESENTALYRSDDLGANWREMDSSGNIQSRPFYFSELVVDPTDFERVYNPAFTLTVSTNGGDSFSAQIGGGFSIPIHPDHHALWINPTNPHQLVIGTDGGVYISESRGATWRHVKTLPVSQFYRVSHDLEWPYNVYGGLQDNGSWAGPSRSPGGIESKDWDNVGFGDGFWTFADPNDPNTVFSEYQGGQLLRFDRKLGTTKSIKPYPEEDQADLRFNWNTPIHLSPNDRGTLYYGSQFLHRSRDRGDSWETISPDLTTNDPAGQRQAESGGLTIDNSTAENYTTIWAIEESLVDHSVIWVGTDDGNLQVTRDAGTTWNNVAENVEGLPTGTWVTSVEAGHRDPGTAFATFDGHRTGDMTTYVAKTVDFGVSWTSLATDEIDGYTWVIRQDPVNPDLLYLGTEFGLYITIDGGQNWARFTENLPMVGVRDLVVHPTEHDLILGTHGRGIYIVDDITPLRHLTNDVLSAEITLLPARPSPMVLGGFSFSFGGGDEFVGANPSSAAGIVYYQKKRHMFGDLKVEIYRGDELLTTLPGSKRKGLNRVDWAMFLKPPKLPPSTALVQAFSGPRVPEGTYRVRLVKGKTTLEGEVHLVPDPRNPYSEEDRRLQQETALALYHRLSDLTYLADTVADLSEQTKAHGKTLGSKDRLGNRLGALADTLDAITGHLAVQKSGGITGQERLREHLGNLYGAVAGYDGRPTDSQLQQMNSVLAELDATQNRFDALVAGDVAAANRELARKKLDELTPVSREAWDAEQDGAASSEAARMLAPHLPTLLGLAGQVR